MAFITTSRSIRSGWRCAKARPTAPQSCTTSRTRWIFEQVEVLLDEARIPVDRVVEVRRLAGAPEAGKVGREPSAAFQEPRPRLSRAPR